MYLNVINLFKIIFVVVILKVILGWSKNIFIVNLLVMVIVFGKIDFRILLLIKKGILNFFIKVFVNGL